MACLQSPNGCQDSVENYQKMESTEMTNGCNGVSCTQSDATSSETSDATSLDGDLRFTVLDCVFLLWCLGTFLFDIGSDLAMCFLHYHYENIWYFGLTFTFVIVPALTMTGFSLRWYLMDENQALTSVSRVQWFVRVVFLILQLAPALRYEQYIYDAVIGVQFIFCCCNPADMPTRVIYTIYYIIAYLENTILMFIWYAHSDPEVWYRMLAVCFHFTSFPVGIMFMLIFYLRCYPVGRFEISEIWISKEKIFPLEQNSLQSPCSLEEHGDLNLYVQKPEDSEYFEKNDINEQFVPQKENLNVLLEENEVVIQELPSQNNPLQTEIRPILEQNNSSPICDS